MTFNTLTRSLLCAGAALFAIGCASLTPPPGAQPAASAGPAAVYRGPPVDYRQPGPPLAAWLRADRRPLPPPLRLASPPQPGQGLDLPLAPVERSLWNRLRASFVLPAHSSRRVAAQLNWYRNHPEYLSRVVARAQPYLHFIVEQVEQRGVPGELALLPVVESAFNVFAYSPGRAAGIWQFIPATGRRYGLKQNWWYDGRRDIYAATNAALDYLQALHTRFKGDWLHALAAYNAGAGNVSRAIRTNRKHGKPIDFWHLRVPRETQSYVPKLIALAMLVRDPQAYGVTLDAVADRPVFRKVATEGQLDLGVAAELAGLPLDELYLLNPAFNRWATDPAGPHYLLLPLGNAARFEAALRDLPQSRRVAWQRHRIKPGESLIVIARRYRTTPRHLRQINNLGSNLIRAGRHLLVPHSAHDSATYTLTAEQRRKQTQARVRKGRKHVHRVAPGDTLWDLATSYGVSAARIAKWNGLSVRDLIRPGQELVLWLDATKKSSSQPSRASLSRDQAVQRIHYTVRQGDSLSRIANRFRVSVGDLKRWNTSRLRGRYLQPGQRLRVYIDVRRQSS